MTFVNKNHFAEYRRPMRNSIMWINYQKHTLVYKHVMKLKRRESVMFVSKPTDRERWEKACGYRPFDFNEDVWRLTRVSSLHVLYPERCVIVIINVVITIVIVVVNIGVTSQHVSYGIRPPPPLPTPPPPRPLPQRYTCTNWKHGATDLHV